MLRLVTPANVFRVVELLLGIGCLGERKDECIGAIMQNLDEQIQGDIMQSIQRIISTVGLPEPRPRTRSFENESPLRAPSTTATRVEPLRIEQPRSVETSFDATHHADGDVDALLGQIAEKDAQIQTLLSQRRQHEVQHVILLRDHEDVAQRVVQLEAELLQTRQRLQTAHMATHEVKHLRDQIDDLSAQSLAVSECIIGKIITNTPHTRWPS